jgi:hypothetical protein
MTTLKQLIKEASKTFTADLETGQIFLNGYPINSPKGLENFITDLNEEWLTPKRQENKENIKQNPFRRVDRESVFDELLGELEE